MFLENVTVTLESLKGFVLSWKTRKSFPVYTLLCQRIYFNSHWWQSFHTCSLWREDQYCQVGAFQNLIDFNRGKEARLLHSLPWCSMELKVLSNGGIASCMNKQALNLVGGFCCSFEVVVRWQSSRFIHFGVLWCHLFLFDVSFPILVNRKKLWTYPNMWTNYLISFILNFFIWNQDCNPIYIFLEVSSIGLMEAYFWIQGYTVKIQTTYMNMGVTDQAFASWCLVEQQPLQV